FLASLIAWLLRWQGQVGFTAVFPNESGALSVGHLGSDRGGGFNRFGGCFLTSGPCCLCGGQEVLRLFAQSLDCFRRRVVCQMSDDFLKYFRVAHCIVSVT